MEPHHDDWTAVVHFQDAEYNKDAAIHISADRERRELSLLYDMDTPARGGLWSGECLVRVIPSEAAQLVRLLREAFERTWGGGSIWVKVGAARYAWADHENLPGVDPLVAVFCRSQQVRLVFAAGEGGEGHDYVATMPANSGSRLVEAIAQALSSLTGPQPSA